MRKPLMISADMTGLTEKLGNLMGALLGTGQGKEGDIRKFLKVEAAQLAWDIGNQLGPKDVAHAKAGVDKSLSYVFRSTRKDGTTPITSNLTAGQQESTTADFNWLYAWSRNGGGVVGINNEDDLRGKQDAAELRQILNAGLKHKRGDAYERLGKRGKMHIMRLNRVLISKSAWRGLAARIMEDVGQLRASFAYTAVELGLKKRIPSFVARHLNGGNRVNGKAIFNIAGLNHPTMPWLEFGSAAKGVNSNRFVVDKIARAVEKRKYTLVNKMNKIIRGYTYNWNTGQTFVSQVKEGGE